ncbi:MAG: hypothetical protein ABWZ53_09515 [Actinomycetota bacterium]
MSVQRFMAAEDEAWRGLCAEFDRVPIARFEEPTVTPEGWSAKDAMFHVAGWMADCAHQLERMRAGSFDPTEESRESIERQTQAWLELSRTMTPVDVRSAFADSRRRMCEAFGDLQELTPDAIEWFGESGALHYAAHAQHLRSWLGGDPA